MSTAETGAQRDSIDVESIDAFFTFAEDDTTPTTSPVKRGNTVAKKPTRDDVTSIAPKAYFPYSGDTHDDPSGSWISAPRCFSVLCFIVGVGMFVRPYFDSPNTTHTAFRPVAAPSLQPHVTTRNIEDCELGHRALGKNPMRDQVETLTEPDPETWRKIILRMRKESGHRLDIQLLRSLSWIESVGAIVHKSFYLNMEEMGVVGDAYVEAILPCPPIRHGEGNVITGVFAHEADPDARILNVTFSDGTYLTGVTDNHPFWSIDRNDFVEIGDMNQGDWVKTASGLTQITKIDSRFARSGEMLYNLETHNEHVFQVTLAGVLVHNNCLGNNMKKAGNYGDVGTDAHHVVAFSHRGAKPARDILRKHRIDLNDPMNGIWLPRNSTVSRARGALHHEAGSALTNKNYLDEVNRRISAADAAGGRAHVLRELQKIRFDLTNGTFAGARPNF